MHSLPIIHRNVLLLLLLLLLLLHTSWSCDSCSRSRLISLSLDEMMHSS